MVVGRVQAVPVSLLAVVLDDSEVVPAEHFPNPFDLPSPSSFGSLSPVFGSSTALESQFPLGSALSAFARVFHPGDSLLDLEAVVPHFSSDEGGGLENSLGKFSLSLLDLPNPFTQLSTSPVQSHAPLTPTVCGASSKRGGGD